MVSVVLRCNMPMFQVMDDGDAGAFSKFQDVAGAGKGSGRKVERTETMAYMTATDNSVSLIGTIAGFFANLRKSVSDIVLFEKTLTELRALNSRELDDLGLAASDLRRIAHESVYGA